MARRKKEEPKKEEKKEINPEDYPVTPIVVAYRDMVTDALNSYKATLPEKITKEQQARIDGMERNMKWAPYELRNSSFKNVRPLINDFSNIEKDDGKKKKTTRKKRATKKKG